MIDELLAPLAKVLVARLAVAAMGFGFIDADFMFMADVWHLRAAIEYADITFNGHVAAGTVSADGVVRAVGFVAGAVVVFAGEVRAGDEIVAGIAAGKGEGNGEEKSRAQKGRGRTALV